MKTSKTQRSYSSASWTLALKPCPKSTGSLEPFDACSPYYYHRYRIWCWSGYTLSNREQVNPQHTCNLFKALLTRSCANWESRHIPRKMKTLKLSCHICENGKIYLKLLTRCFILRAAMDTEIPWMTMMNKYCTMCWRIECSSTHLLSVDWSMRKC